MGTGSVMGVRVRLVFPTICFGLGTWQLYRLQWKTKLLADIEEGVSGDPILIDRIDALTEKLEKLQYRRIKLNGFLLGQQSVLVGPRSSKNIIDSDLGFILIRDIYDKSGQPLLMNDGWVGWRSERDEKPPDLNQAEFVLDRTEMPSSFVQGNDPEKNIWRWKQIDHLAEAMNTRPIMLKRITREEGTATPARTTFDIPNRHLEYVLTWYGISLTTFILSFMKR